MSDERREGATTWSGTRMIASDTEMSDEQCEACGREGATTWSGTKTGTRVIACNAEHAKQAVAARRFKRRPPPPASDNDWQAALERTLYFSEKSREMSKRSELMGKMASANAKIIHLLMLIDLKVYQKGRGQSLSAFLDNIEASFTSDSMTNAEIKLYMLPENTAKQDFVKIGDELPGGITIYASLATLSRLLSRLCVELEMRVSSVKTWNRIVAAKAVYDKMAVKARETPELWDAVYTKEGMTSPETYFGHIPRDIVNLVSPYTEDIQLPALD